MKFYKVYILLFLTLGLAQGANAALVKFNATGVAGISGYVEFDDSSFNGSTSQFVLNSFVTDLSLSVFGDVFSFSDVVTSDDTIFDSSGVNPIIVNGAGNLADNGTTAIAFFPDGFNATAVDGDASLAVGLSGSLADEDFYAVKWELARQVPEPGALLLLASGLLILRSFKSKSN